MARDNVLHSFEGLTQVLEEKQKGVLANIFGDAFAGLFTRASTKVQKRVADDRPVIFVLHLMPSKPDDLATLWVYIRYVLQVKGPIVFPNDRFEVRQVRAGERLTEAEEEEAMRQNKRIVYLDTGLESKGETENVEVVDQHGFNPGGNTSSMERVVRRYLKEGERIPWGLEAIIEHVNRSDNIKRLDRMSFHYWCIGLPHAEHCKGADGQTNWHKVYLEAFRYLDMIYAQSSLWARSQHEFEQTMKNDPKRIFTTVKRGKNFVRFMKGKARDLKVYILHEDTYLRASAFENPIRSKRKEFDADIVFWTVTHDAYEHTGTGPERGIWCGVQAHRDVDIDLTPLAARMRQAYAKAWGIKLTKKELNQVGKVEKTAPDKPKIPVMLGDNKKFLLCGSTRFPLRSDEFPPFTAKEFETMCLTVITES